MLDWSSRTRACCCCSGLIEAANIATDGDSRRTAVSVTDAEGRRPIRSSPAGSPAGSARRLGERSQAPAGRRASRKSAD